MPTRISPKLTFRQFVIDGRRITSLAKVTDVRFGNIGSLRNSFAHQLNFKLSADRMRSLYNCFDSDGQQIVQNAYDASRKQRLASKHPKKIWALDPKDQFSLLAATMRVILLLAHQQQTEGVDGKPPPRPAD